MPKAETSTVSPREAAHRLGVTDRTIRNWIAEGKIAATRLSERVTRVPIAEIERLERAARRPRRPDLESVLWDVDESTIDADRHARFIVARVLEAGRPAQLAWVFRRYPVELIADVAADERAISPRASSAWSVLLEERIRAA